MISDHLVAGFMIAVHIYVGELGRGLHDRAQQIDVVVVMGALQQGGQPLQAHAGIDGWFRQLDALIRAQLLELHEDEIPDLDKTVAVLVRAAGRTTGNGRAMIEKNLGTGPAGASIAHGPEIVRGCDADDALLGQAGNLAPQIKGLIIVMIDRDQQAVRIQAVFLGDQVPGQLDRAFLEIIAKGEITQHLKKRMVPRCIAYIIQIVMLTSRPDAFLRGNSALIGPRLGAGEDILELHHARVGEHQGRIIVRHQG